MNIFNDSKMDDAQRRRGTISRIGICLFPIPGQP